MKAVACQVCGDYTISEHGSFDICPVCYWEDDGLYEDPDEVWGGPAFLTAAAAASTTAPQEFFAK